MSRYRFVKQDVTEARRRFCRTLKDMSASDADEEVVVIVTRRGDPLATVISAAEAERYFAWRAEEIPPQDGDREEEETDVPPEETAVVGDPEPLPEGWPTPAEYCRHCIAKGCSPETTAEAIVENYAPYGMSGAEAGRIVERVFGEEAAD